MTLFDLDALIRFIITLVIVTPFTLYLAGQLLKDKK